MQLFKFACRRILVFKIWDLKVLVPRPNFQVLGLQVSGFQFLGFQFLGFQFLGFQVLRFSGFRFQVFESWAFSSLGFTFEVLRIISCVFISPSPF